MSNVERWACCNPLWRALTGRALLPWVCAGTTLKGEVLEVGAGGGANASSLLARFADIRLTATDLDPAVLASARQRLRRFGGRAEVTEADVTQLSFDDAAFDGVVSMIMLHHVGDWRRALSEVARVLRPDGRFLGYDLTARGRGARQHGHAGSDHVYLSPEELDEGLSRVGMTEVTVQPSLGGLIMRFSARKP